MLLARGEHRRHAEVDHPDGAEPAPPVGAEEQIACAHSADSVMRRRSRPFAAPVGRLAGVQVGVHQVVREQHLVVDVDAFQRTPTREVTSGLRAAFAGSRRRAPRCTM